MRNAFDELINQLDGSRPRSPELEDISIEAAESGKTEEQKKIQNKTTELFKVVESQLLKAEIVSSTNGVGMMDIHLQKKKTRHNLHSSKLEAGRRRTQWLSYCFRLPEFHVRMPGFDSQLWLLTPAVL